MNSIDINILKLIDLLIYKKQIKSLRHFCQNISMAGSTISKIKVGTAHFTVNQIKIICQVYNVNANWIFGLERKVFNTVNSIELVH